MSKEANNKAISIRYEAVKGQAATGCLQHQLRTGRLPGYVDRDRIAENTIMVFRQTDTQQMTQELEKSRQEKGQTKLRRDAKIFLDSVITFGSVAQEKLNSLTSQQQDEMFLRVARDQAAEHGHELLQLVVHRDEQALHAHALYRASRVVNGKEKSWSYNKKDLSRFQDVAAASVKNLGIERGFRKADRLAAGASWKDVTHKSVAQLHREMRRDYELSRRLRAQRQRLEQGRKPVPPQPVNRATLSWKFPFFRREKVVPQETVSVYEKRLKDWQVGVAAQAVLSRDQARQKLDRALRDVELSRDKLEYERGFAQDVVDRLCDGLGLSRDVVRKFVAGEIAQEAFIQLVQRQTDEGEDFSPVELG